MMTTLTAAEGPERMLELDRLVRSAAYTGECPYAVFYHAAEDGWRASVSFGASSLPQVADNIFLARAAELEDELLVVADATLETTLSEHDVQLFDDVPLIRFVTATPIKSMQGRLHGVLAIADDSPHAGLSAAQRYVLQTHALALAARLDERQGSARPAATDNSPTMERLRLLESVVVNANDTVLITEAEPIDPPGPRIVYCNAAFTKTTGYTEAEVLGLTPRILQNDNVDRTTLDRLKSALQRWQPIEVELLNCRKDGSEFWVEMSIVPVANAQGRFTHWVSVQRDISERKRVEEVAVQARIAQMENRALETQLLERQSIETELMYAAFHDDLTKLRNRAFFMDRLNIALNQARSRQSHDCAVLFLDLDRFKLINDSLGHRAGDLLLMEVARRLEHCIRATDTLARVGGDEFVLLLEGISDISAAISMSEHIVETLREPCRLGHQDVFTSCSIGIVKVMEHYLSPEELLRDADIAMYEAKRSGINSFAIFTEAMRASAVETLSLQTDLRHAIVHNEFFLNYQPIYDLTTYQIRGVEALVRWHHPQRGQVPPALFISSAEEIGAIREIGRWVLKNACLQLQEWQTQYPGLELRLSVNVSANELRYAHFIPELKALLTATHFNANHLLIEITENVFLHDPEVIGQVLADVRLLGVKVALDDFGTGYSALGYIDRYQIDVIKIDQSFILRMLTHKRTMAIVQSILNLGQALDLDIIAEGVETKAQLDMLRAMRCKYVQGYLLSRPLSAEELTKRLATLKRES